MQRSKTYHHGNLRAALLSAARDVIDEAGVDALTLREVARRAGVSPAAPYHHFTDKADLVAALARQSLVDLDHTARDALEGIHDPHEQLRAFGVVYVLYALEHRAAFRLMFRAEKGAPFDASNPEAEPVFGLLLQIIDACRVATKRDHHDRDTLAIEAWSLAHGLATLLIDGPLASMAADLPWVRVLVTDIMNRFEVS